MILSALKSSCLLAAAVLALAAPQMAQAGAKGDGCKPAKVVHKAKARKPKVHKVKAKAGPSGATTVAATHRVKPKIIRVASDAPRDCRHAGHGTKGVEPATERGVTIYRAEPRKWHAPYVDEVASGKYATYAGTAHREDTQVVQRIYIRNDHYLAVDTRPGRHRHARWTRWID